MLNKLLFSEDKSHLGRCTREEPTEREQRHYWVCRTYYTDLSRQKFHSFQDFFFSALQLLLLHLRFCSLVLLSEVCFDTEKSE